MLLAPGSGSRKDGDGSHNNADANSNHTPTDTNTDNNNESNNATPHPVVPADPNKPKPNEGEAHENGGDPPGTKRNSAGRLIDAKTGRFVKDPNVKKKKKKNQLTKGKKSAQLKKNKENGLKREAEVKKELTNEGHEVIGSQVSVKTKHTRRVVDHMIKEKGTENIKAVEVKSGNATRNKIQKLKDLSMENDGGTVIGKSAPKNLKGKTIKIETIIRN